MNLASQSAAVIAAVSISPILAIAHADTIPVSRTSTVLASWYQHGGYQPTGGNASDGTTTFEPFSRTVSAGGGGASQTSAFTPTTVNVNLSANGYHNNSVMNAAGCDGTSTFTYIFDLTEPATLSFTGNYSFSSPYAPFGIVRLYDAAGSLVYQPNLGTLTYGTLVFPFSDTYTAPAGRYRFFVQSYSGNGYASTQVTMTLPMAVPAPAAVAWLPLTAFAAVRRRRP